MELNWNINKSFWLASASLLFAAHDEAMSAFLLIRRYPDTQTTWLIQLRETDSFVLRVLFLDVRSNEGKIRKRESLRALYPRFSSTLSIHAFHPRSPSITLSPSNFWSPNHFPSTKFCKSYHVVVQPRHGDQTLPWAAGRKRPSPAGCCWKRGYRSAASGDVFLRHLLLMEHQACRSKKWNRTNDWILSWC